jgi:ABC-type lipoprotein release transport system permease subunit
MVMYEAAMVAALSAAAGCLTGFLVHLYFSTHGLPMDIFYSGESSAAGVAFDPVIYSHLSANRILGCTALVVGMTLLLALFPARRAARAGDVSLLGRA